MICDHPINTIYSGWRMELNLEKIQTPPPLIEVIILSHIHRSTNKVADIMENEGATSQLNTIDQQWNSQVTAQLMQDCHTLAKANFTPSRVGCTRIHGTSVVHVLYSPSRF